MLKTCSSGGQQRLDEFCVAQLAQEAQGVAANVFVGVLEIHTNAIAGGQG